MENIDYCTESLLTARDQSQLSSSMPDLKTSSVYFYNVEVSPDKSTSNNNDDDKDDERSKVSVKRGVQFSCDPETIINGHTLRRPRFEINVYLFNGN